MVHTVLGLGGAKKKISGKTSGGKQHNKTIQHIFNLGLSLGLTLFLITAPTQGQAATTCTIGTVTATVTIDTAYITTNNCSDITVTNNGNGGNIILRFTEPLDLVDAGTFTIQSGVTAVLDGVVTLGVDDQIKIVGTAQQAAGDTRGLSFEAQNIQVTATGRIDVVGKGCAGGEMYHAGSGPDLNAAGNCVEGVASAGQAGGSGGAGGGYGGKGSGALWAVGGTTYSVDEQPFYLGSGGGSGATYNDGATGSAGGGKIRLIAHDTLEVFGVITAKGKKGNNGWQYGGGGGSGGSIWVTTQSLTGSGVISADGGDAGSGNSNVYAAGAGGGGRILVEYQAGTLNVENVTAKKGGGGDAKNGTTYLLKTALDNTTHLTVISGLTFHDEGDYSHETITVYPDAYVLCNRTQPLTITTQQLTWTGGQWLCDSSLSNITLVVDELQTTNMNWTWSNTAAVNFQLNTWVTAGDNNVLNITKAGALVDWDIQSDLELNNVTYVGPVHAGAASALGGVLTLDNPIAVSLQHSTLATSLRWTNITALTVDAQSQINASDVGCRGGGGTANVENADGYGPDSTTNVCAVRTTGYGKDGATGAAYGGVGGDGWGQTGTLKSEMYGINTNPILFGAGGGGSCYGGQGCSKGGDGGGLVYIATPELNLAGTIMASGGNGNASSYWYGAGGGSGGSVYIAADMITGSGTIAAQGGGGGDGATNADGAGGGGGRVAVYYNTDANDLLQNNITVGGGLGLNATTTDEDGKVGTIYLHRYTVPAVPVLITPLSKTYNNSLTPQLVANVYQSNGKIHSTSEWKITTDLAGQTLAWQSGGVTDHLTDINVDQPLASFTTYYAWVRYANVIGWSEWSLPVRFTTQYAGPAAEYTWDFNESQPAYFYSHAVTTVDVNSNSNGVARLYPQANPIYNTYATAGLTNGASGWHKRKTVTITNQVDFALTDYPVQVIVTHDHLDMQADFDDIRFTAADGKTELDYWRQEKVDNISAVFWVKVPQLPASDTVTMFMYYGMADVTTTSNGQSVFPQFDDFTTTLNSDWIEVTRNTGQAGSIANGVWTKTCTGDTGTQNCDWWSGNLLDAGLRQPLPTLPTDIGWEVVTRLTDASTSGARHMGLMLYQDNNNLTDNIEDGLMWGYSPSESWFEVERVGTGNLCKSVSTAVPSLLKIQRVINPLTDQAAFSFWRSTDATTWSGCLKSDSTLYTVDAPMAEAGLFVKDWGTGPTTASYDYFFTRPLVETEPVVALASDERMTFAYNHVSITPATTGFHPSYGQLYTFSYAQISELNQGNIRFQIGLDTDGNGPDAWYYHNGEQWTLVIDEMTHFNTAADVNTYLPAFVEEIGTGDFYFRGYLLSDGVQPVQLDGVTLTYDGPPPFSDIPELVVWEDVPAEEEVDLTDHFNDPTHRLTYSILDDLDPAYGRLVVEANGQLSIYPKENVFGEQVDTIQVRATTPGGFVTDSNVVSVSIYPNNDEPLAADDQVDLITDTLAMLDVLNNDSDIDGDALVVTIITPPQHGTAVVRDNQTIQYQPNVGFSGEDSIIYEVTDENGGLATARVVIRVASNTLPTQPPIVSPVTPPTQVDPSTPIETQPGDTTPGEQPVNSPGQDTPAPTPTPVQPEPTEDTNTTETPTQEQSPDEQTSQPPDRCNDENGIDNVRTKKIDYVTGSNQGKGTIKAYNKYDELVRCWKTFGKGGVRAKFSRYQKKAYTYSVKYRSGTTLHIDNAKTGRSIFQQRLSPQMHLRQVAYGQLDHNQRTQEIVTSVRRGDAIYIKIYTFDTKRHTVQVSKKFVYQGYTARQHQLVVKQKKILLYMPKEHSMVMVWQPQRNLAFYP